MLRPFITIPAIGFVISFANYLIYYSYPFLLKELNISIGIAGIVVGFASFFTMFFRIASGIYLDKIGGKYVITTVTVVYSLSFALLSCQMYQLVILGRIFIGISLGMLATILMFYTVAFATSGVQIGQGIALYTFFSMLPTCLAPYLSLEIMRYHGTKAIVVVAVILAIIGVVLAYLLESKFARDGTRQQGSSFSIRDWIAVIRNRDLYIALSGLGMLYTISGATISFLPEMLESTNPGYTGAYLMTYSIAMLLPRLFLKGHMPVGEIFPAKSFLFVAALALGGCTLNYALLSTPGILLGAVMNGMALGYIYPAMSAYVICQCPDHMKGSMVAVSACVADGGVILANFTLGVFAINYPHQLVLLLPIGFAACAMALFVLAYYFSTIKKPHASLSTHSATLK